MPENEDQVWKRNHDLAGFRIFQLRHPVLIGGSICEIFSCFFQALFPQCSRFTPTRVGITTDLTSFAQVNRRFTPTRVGITSSRPRRRWRRAVHPHTRGDHLWEKHGYRRIYGSPPHAWGSQPGSGSANGCHRFTPTRVGITPYLVPWLPLLPVHPHTRGDHYSANIPGVRQNGSPPHAWGSQFMDFLWITN